MFKSKPSLRYLLVHDNPSEPQFPWLEKMLKITGTSETSCERMTISAQCLELLVCHLYVSIIYMSVEDIQDEIILHPSPFPL